jgi:hypothetical protein
MVALKQFVEQMPMGCKIKQIALQDTEIELEYNFIDNSLTLVAEVFDKIFQQLFEQAKSASKTV